MLAVCLCTILVNSRQAHICARFYKHIISLFANYSIEYCVFHRFAAIFAENHPANGKESVK